MSATAFTLNDEQRTGRFSDLPGARSMPPVKPAKPGKHDRGWETCPCCDQRVPPDRWTFYTQFGGGVRRLCVAALMIISALLRCARFVVAGGLCLFGLVGVCMRAVGFTIAHPDDRRLLLKLRWDR